MQKSSNPVDMRNTKDNGFQNLWVHTDAQGSVVALTLPELTVTDEGLAQGDDFKDNVNAYVLGPFGVLDAAEVHTLHNEDAVYTGKLYDHEANLLYFHHRYYDPETKRFISEDPAPIDITDPRTINRFTFVNNNPLRFVDPDGRHPLIVGAVIGTGAAINFGIDYYQSWKASGMSIRDYWNSGQYSNLRGAGQLALGGATTAGGGAIGALKWGGKAATLLSRGSLSAGLGMANTQASNMMFNKNDSVGMGALYGLTGYGLGAGFGSLANKISPTTMTSLGTTIKYGLEGYKFGLNPNYAAGQIGAQAGGDFLNFGLGNTSLFQGIENQYNSFFNFEPLPQLEY